MPTKLMRGLNLILDARPDRVDTRDLRYRPPLVSLPDRCPDDAFIKKNYGSYSKFILDQGKEGACTGFGLAAMINYLMWKRALNSRRAGRIGRVSPTMLYHMARLYDEWTGEDYEGSSCRGAMKGWHRHGACIERLWRAKGKKFVKPQTGWQQDAATRPLGAYYRINKNSVLDLQAAIHEVGAIYVSAQVSDSWDVWNKRKLEVIPPAFGDQGGHAFALVGYTPLGFIVQNSWGPTWGYHGFAIMSYQDWIDHGSDAWVAVLGAPMLVAADSPEAKVRTRRSVGIRDAIGGKAEWSWRSDTLAKSARRVPPLNEGDAYEHSVVLGNDGLPINRFVDCADAIMAVEEAALRLPLAWLAQQKSKKLLLYAHGGLNSEEGSLKRIRVLVPYFRANGIYPLFYTWRTGALESIAGMLEDSVERFFSRDGEPARGFFEAIKDQLADAKDRSIEVACESLLVKPIWSQMKQNAAAAAQPTGGLTLVADHLLALTAKIPGLEIHLAGHSAGSILLGHLLPMLVGRQIPVASCTLFAPACTVSFALEYYKAALQAKLFTPERLAVHVMSDAREQGDVVGPYGKSLLYLVSRALEDVHKIPLLGMEGAWRTVSQDFWHDTYAGDVAAWRSFATKVQLVVHSEPDVTDGVEQIPLAHGSFDNDLAVITSLIQDIRGAKVATEVDNLHGF